MLRSSFFRDAYQTRDEAIPDVATEKQIAYAKRLLAESAYAEGEREQLAASLDTMTRGRFRLSLSV